MAPELADDACAADVPQQDLPVATTRRKLAVVARHRCIAHFIAVAQVRFDGQALVWIPQAQRAVLQGGGSRVAGCL